MQKKGAVVNNAHLWSHTGAVPRRLRGPGTTSAISRVTRLSRRVKDAGGRDETAGVEVGVVIQSCVGEEERISQAHETAARGQNRTNGQRNRREAGVMSGWRQ